MTPPPTTPKRLAAFLLLFLLLCLVHPSTNAPAASAAHHQPGQAGFTMNERPLRDSQAPGIIPDEYPSLRSAIKTCSRGSHFKISKRTGVDHIPAPGVYLQIHEECHVVCTPGVMIKEGPLVLTGPSSGSVACAKLQERCCYTISVAGRPWMLDACEIRCVAGCAIRAEGEGALTVRECTVGGEGMGDDRTRDCLWLCGKSNTNLVECTIGEKPQTQTPDPKPQTPNPRPQTQDLKHTVPSQQCDACWFV